MKVLSFDVGIKNLSYCIMTMDDNKTIKINDWNILEVTDANCKKIKLDDLSCDVLTCLNNNFNIDDELFDSIDYVIIENQPCLKNGNMKTVAVIIYTFFQMRKLQYNNIKQVRFISASNKLKVNKGKELGYILKKDTYKERKQTSIELTRKYLVDMCPEKLEWFNSCSKADDLADAYLQSIYFFENI
jgi:hypothetical protein